METRIVAGGKLRGRVKVPGDKSISHRALILSAMTRGKSILQGLLYAEDTRSTYKCLQQMGVYFCGDWTRLQVHGKGLHGFTEPGEVLDAGNSGTTARLLMGLLAGQPFFSVITGDKSLVKRPMARISAPLRRMGASIDGRHGGACLPLCLRGGALGPIDYCLPVASAQLKSALLLAALYAPGTSRLTGKTNSRDHTERMLRYLGAEVSGREGNITLTGGQTLQGKTINIPGDISAAAFFLVAGALSPGGEILLEGVGINPGRAGVLEVLLTMGADIEILHRREYGGEPVADLHVKGGRPLRGVEIGGAMIPRLVDEIPALAVAALFASGKTIIREAAELRLKESDRLRAISRELGKMGACIREQPDGLIITGGNEISGARCCSHGDHRIAMSLAVAALSAGDETIIEGTECIDISYPAFFDTLHNLRC